MERSSDVPIMLTPKGVAHILHVHVNTVRRWESRGILRGYRIGPRRDRRFQQDEILRLVSTANNENNGRQ